MLPLTAREKRRCAELFCTLDDDSGECAWLSMADVAERLTNSEFACTEAEVEDAVRWCLNHPEKPRRRKKHVRPR